MEEKGDALDRCNVETMDAKRHRGTNEEVLFNVSAMAEVIKKNKTAIVKRNHLNFTFPDISSSINGRIRLFYVSWRV